MQLGPTELARLLVFQAAELARRHRALGLPLNAPEAVAIATDEMHLAARRGGSFDEVLAAGYSSVRADELMEGVAPLIDEIRVEVHLGDGMRLLVLRGLGRDGSVGGEPGAVEPGTGEIVINAGLSTVDLVVANDSDHPIRISSHFPFERANPRLRFDRAAATGTRLDIPAGDTVGWEPGEVKTVRLVRLPHTPARPEPEEI